MTQRMLLVASLWLVAACARAPQLSKAATIQPTDIREQEMSLVDIREQLWGQDDSIVFRPSTLVERDGVATIISGLLDRARAGQTDGDVRDGLGALATRARGIGFRLELWRMDGQRLWALVEADGQRRGAGAYIVRTRAAQGQSVAVVLQAPHAYYDMGTGDIALALFASDERVDALFVNTLHRYWRADGEFSRRERSPSDVCHRADHVFQYATSAAARTLGRVVVMQMHGFADSSARPDAILSSGDVKGSPPIIHRLASALGEVIDDVRRFPEDFADLGGTTNAQGRLLSVFPHAHFVHVELSASTRKRLRADPDELAKLAAKLFGPALAEPKKERSQP